MFNQPTKLIRKSKKRDLQEELRDIITPPLDLNPPSRSTGPITPEGKKRSALNSLKHGFTAQCVTISADDIQNYKAHLASFHDEHKPATPTETFLVESLAEISWTVSRIRAQEQNYMSLVGQTVRVPCESPSADVNTVMAQAYNLKNDLAQIDLLSRYEQRKMRVFREALRDLTALQANRKQPEREKAEELPVPLSKPTAKPAAHFVCPPPKTMTAQAPPPPLANAQSTPNQAA